MDDDSEEEGGEVAPRLHLIRCADGEPYALPSEEPRRPLARLVPALVALFVVSALVAWAVVANR